jgi:8-oxo-dGTP diphosphatase
MAKYCYPHPRPAVTVDLVAFTVDDGIPRVLLVRRKRAPFAGNWALPGGFLEIDEPVEEAVRREVLEETGVTIAGRVRPLGFFGEPGRDPRGRTISLVHVALIRPPAPKPMSGDDAADAAWVTLQDFPQLAFDHSTIFEQSLYWLSREITMGNGGLELLPEHFDDDDVRTLFRGLFSTARGAASWRRHQESAGRIARVRGKRARYRAVGGEVLRGPADADRVL